MAGHWVTSVLSPRDEDGDPTAEDQHTFECDEGHLANCQWTSDCGCEQWVLERDDGGVFHTVMHYDPNMDEETPVRHAMRRDPDGCTLVPWWDNGGLMAFEEEYYGRVRPGRHQLHARWMWEYVEFLYADDPKADPAPITHGSRPELFSAEEEPVGHYPECEFTEWQQHAARLAAQSNDALMDDLVEKFLVRKEKSCDCDRLRRLEARVTGEGCLWGQGDCPNGPTCPECERMDDLIAERAAGHKETVRAAIEAITSIHAEDVDGTCTICEMEEWPCLSVRAIQEIGDAGE